MVTHAACRFLAPELRECGGLGCLSEVEMLLSIASDIRRLEDLDGLTNRFNLFCAQLLLLIIGKLFLLAFHLHLCQTFLVFLLHGDSGCEDGDFMNEMGPDYQAPEANAYEFQSGGIIEMLKKLRDEFRTKLADCQKEEMNSKHAYDMVVQDLVDSIENANQSIEEKKVTKARKEEKAASDKKELAATISMKKDDEKTLSEMQVECKEKGLSFGEKQQLRTEEIEAIAQAIKILQSGDVSGNAEKHLDLAQTSKTTAFAQLRGQESVEGVRGHIRDFITSESKRLPSRNLALLAQKMLADPFGKVKKMIDEMITRLLNEANEDAQHEGFCDK